MSLPPLPVLVIGGYLGAGKTSLVNHLLRHAGGRRLMVLVNDFGAVNVDAELLVSATEDTLTLANGCVCCTLGGDLMFALADALDRRPRPDALVIEASGVAEPRKIANAALAEPEMRLAGVVVLADAANLPALLDDPRIGAQAADQLRAADLVALTKTDLADATETRARLAALVDAPVVEAPHGALPVAMLLDRTSAAQPDPAPEAHAHDHGAAYESWSHEGPEAPTRAAAEAFFRAAEGVYRLKGRLRLAEGGGLELHRVGRIVQAAPCPEPDATRLAAIWPAGAAEAEALAEAWRRAVAGDLASAKA
jgi:G3E family GTPase